MNQDMQQFVEINILMGRTPHEFDELSKYILFLDAGCALVMWYQTVQQDILSGVQHKHSFETK